MPPWVLAWAVTVGVEVPLVALVYRQNAWRMGLACFIATSATNIAMNTLLPRLVSTYSTYLFVGETLATLLEALAYFAVASPRDLGKALIASALANAASFGAGILLTPILFSK